MTKKTFYELAAHHGITVDYTPGGVDKRYAIKHPFHIMLDAPAGKLFAATELHVDGSIQGEEGTTTTDWRAATQGLKEILAAGFVDCTDPDCDMCHPEGDD